jgi:hypothetical protein
MSGDILGTAAGILGAAAGIAVAVLDFLEKHNGAVTGVATVFIAAFTFTLKRSTDKLWKLARRDFIATHRPRVGVAFIQGPDVRDSRQLVWVTVRNSGGSDAIILEWGCDLVRRKGNQWLTGIDGSPKKVEPIRLISGQHHFFEVFAKGAYDVEAAIFEEALGEVETCVIGAIRFADENGTMRETGFLRTYDASSEKFVPSANPEDEYQA